MSIAAAILFGLCAIAAYCAVLAFAWWAFDRSWKRRAGAELAQWRRIRRYVR